MERNKSLDLIKGCAVISVIIYHVTEITGDTILKSFINTYVLSIFFFVSGYLTNKEKISVEWTKRKFIYLIIPFFVNSIFLSIFERLHNNYNIKDVCSYFFTDAKGGYCFLFILFLFYCTIFILRKIEKKIKSTLLKVIVLIFPFFISVVCSYIFPDFICSTLSIYSYRRYWLFFVYGYFFNNYIKTDLGNRRMGIISLALYIPLAVLYSYSIKELQTYSDFLFWIFIDIIAIHAWLFVSNLLSSNFKLNIMTQIGKNSLGVYVFQFYPIFICKQYLPFQLYGTFYSFIYTFLATLFCLFITYIMVSICKKNGYTSFLFLGNYKK